MDTPFQKSDWINNMVLMDNIMRISGIESSSVIQYSKSLYKNVLTSWSQKGWL